MAGSAANEAGSESCNGSEALRRPQSEAKPDRGSGAERPNGRRKPQAKKRSNKPGSTRRRSPRKWESLEGRERPVTSGRSRSGTSTRCALRHRAGGRRKRQSGSGKAKRPAILNATLNTVHAGGERGCKSSHLEPFFLARHLFRS